MTAKNGHLEPLKDFFSRPEVLKNGLTKLQSLANFILPSAKPPLFGRVPRKTPFDQAPTPGTFSSQSEIQAYAALENLKRYDLYTNIALTSIFEIDHPKLTSFLVASGYGAADLQMAATTLQTQIGAQSAADILAVSRDTGALEFVLEVDGSHHAHEDQAKYDFRKNLLFLSCSTPVLRIFYDKFPYGYALETSSTRALLEAAAQRWKAFSLHKDVVSMRAHIPKEAYPDGWQDPRN